MVSVLYVVLCALVTSGLAYAWGWVRCENQARRLLLRAQERHNAALLAEMDRTARVTLELRECNRALALANEQLAARIAPKPGTWE